MKEGFVREVYLRSEPSVDLATIEGKVDCCRHTLKMSVYDEILKEFGVEEGTDEYLACNMFMLMSGPQLIN